jgi:hypothetical protein
VIGQLLPFQVLGVGAALAMLAQGPRPRPGYALVLGVLGWLWLTFTPLTT